MTSLTTPSRLILIALIVSTLLFLMPDGNLYKTGAAYSTEALVTKIGSGADLAISLTGTPDPVMIFRRLTYSLVVTNNGPDPAIDARVTNTLPSGVSLISIETTRGYCSGRRELTCALGDLPAGESAEITIRVRPFRTGTIADLVSVTSVTTDINPANNTMSLETSVSLRPSIYGRVATAGGAGLNGVSVAVEGSGKPPALTSEDGKYQVSELEIGERYTVTPSRQGYVFNPVSRTIRYLLTDRQVDFGAVACELAISPASQSIPAAGGQGSVTITSPDPRCPWTATTDVPWIRFISATSGRGSATVNFEVERTTGSRTGTIAINDTRVTVFQESDPCNTLTFNNAKILSLNGIQPAATPAFVAEDFNNDSVSDLVLNVSQPAAGLSIATSNASGGYEDPRMIYTGGVSKVRAGDLNNNGVKDLAVITNEAPGRLLLLTGDGAGGFSAPANIETGPSPMALAIADFNGDGISDLAVTTGPQGPEPIPDSYNLAIYLGDGAGGFSAARNFGFTTRFGSLPSQLETGDFNGDGIPDLAVLGSAGPAIIFIGDGSMGFTISSLSNVTQAGMMALGDFNGDLKTDLAISQFGNGNILIWISTPGGVFQPAQSVAGQLLLAADLNGDGKSDLLLRSLGDISVLFATSDGHFTEPERYIPGGASNLAAVGDFKRDGRDLRTDLFIILSFSLPFRAPSIDVAVLTPDAQGDFDAPRAINYLPPNTLFSGNLNDMESGDLNGDGVLDLVIADSGLPDVVTMLGKGGGEFNAAVTVNSGVTSGSPRAIELGDFNHDGISDLAVIYSASQKIVVMLGNGQGGFTPTAQHNTGNDPRNLVLADFNNDGNLDLVAKAQSGDLALFLGDGLGAFTESSTGIGGNLAILIFTTGDFNGDGNVDIVYGDVFQAPSPEGLKVLFGNGQGGFAAPINVRTDTNVGFISVADFNLDGRDDLVYSSAASGIAVFVVLSNSGGSFNPPVPYQAAFDVSDILPKDINGDGKLDLIVSTSGDASVSLLLGNGDGTFNQVMSFRIFDALSLIKTGDFDGDGDIDIAFARSNFPQFGVLQNRSMCSSEQR
jgi:uncharacterized repeat protein (TIGR01451 family)